MLAEWEKALVDTGYVSGQNVLFEYRFADGQGDRLRMLAANFVQRQVAVLVENTTPPALAAKAATTTIPIVFMTGVTRTRWDWSRASTGRALTSLV